jgi:hypothetical protein
LCIGVSVFDVTFLGEWCSINFRGTATWERGMGSSHRGLKDGYHRGLKDGYHRGLKDGYHRGRKELHERGVWGNEVSPQGNKNIP